MTTLRLSTILALLILLCSCASAQPKPTPPPQFPLTRDIFNDLMQKVGERVIDPIDTPISATVRADVTTLLVTYAQHARTLSEYYSENPKRAEYWRGKEHALLLAADIIASIPGEREGEPPRLELNLPRKPMPPSPKSAKAD
jgi:hypothetical protein